MCDYNECKSKPEIAMSWLTLLSKDKSEYTRNEMLLCRSCGQKTWDLLHSYAKESVSIEDLEEDHDPRD